MLLSWDIIVILVGRLTMLVIVMLVQAILTTAMLVLSMLAVAILVQAGSVTSNGSEPRSCLGRVFKFKLGSFT